MRMRSSLVVRASDCQCTSCNGPGFDLSIRRHSGIWGAADEAVLNIVGKKYKKSPEKNIFKKMFINMHYFWTCTEKCQNVKYIVKILWRKELLASAWTYAPNVDNKFSCREKQKLTKSFVVRSQKQTNEQLFDLLYCIVCGIQVYTSVHIVCTYVQNNTVYNCTSIKLHKKLKKP